MAAPVSDRWLACWALVVLGASVLVGWLLNVAGKPGVAIVVTFWLMMIPSFVFVGCVLGPYLKFPPWARVISTITAAATLAYIYPF